MDGEWRAFGGGKEARGEEAMLVLLFADLMFICLVSGHKMGFNVCV